MKIQNKINLLFNVVKVLFFISFPLIFLDFWTVDSLWALLISWQYWIFLLTFILIDYLHLNKLVRYFWAGKKYLLYVVSLFILLYLTQEIQPFDKLLQFNRSNQHNLSPRQSSNFVGPPMPPPMGNTPVAEPPRLAQNLGIDITSLYLFVILIAIGWVQYLISNLIVSQNRLISVEKEKAQTELYLLKSQIHPHFLFNTLNNIYGLVLDKREEAGESLLKLSNLMRYFLEEQTSEKVQITNEVNFIKDYIALQKLRLSKNGIITEDYIGLEYPQYIPPFILMPFVENIFKYGVSKKAHTEIVIRLSVTEHQIEFYTSNQIFKNSETEMQGYGIGIQNIKRQLLLLYPDRHTLEIHNNGIQFIVHLKITSDAAYS